MALNPEKVAASKAALPAQIKHISTHYPYIGEVVENNNLTCFKSDYFGMVDLIGHSRDGHRHYNIQCKARESGNDDFVLPVLRLSGYAAENARIGFYYEGVKYSFDLGYADIFVETINNRVYSITREELQTLEAQPLLWSIGSAVTAIRCKKIVADNGDKKETDEYYAFFSTQELMALREKLALNAISPSFGFIISFETKKRDKDACDA